MERKAVMKRIRDDGLKKNAAAKLLGVSRQRITQLYAAFLKAERGGAPMPEPEKPAADPLDHVFTPEPEPPPASPPGSVDDVLAPIGGGAPPQPTPPGHASKPADVPPRTPPTSTPGDGGEQVDPEDASAGRELVQWFVRGVKEGFARWVLKMKKDDPRLAELREHNEFLRISIKRNSEKAAPLGKLTKGWWGLLIGASVEALRAAFIVGETEDVPATATPATVKPSESRRESPADNADVEAPAAPRETLAEKIKRMNGGG